jgi:hypothetical protein
MFAIVVCIGCAGQVKEQKETLFYPPLPQQPRLQFLTSISTETDLGGGGKSAFKEFLIGDDTSEKAIGRPLDIGASKDRIYIVDGTHLKVLILDLKKKEFSFIKGTRLGAYSHPVGIWVTENDFKYLTDFKRKQVIVYDRDNNYVRSYGKAGELEKPYDVAVFEERVYVSDFDRHQITVYDKETGEVIQTIGVLGNDEGEFYKPAQISVDVQGNLYVTDAFNYRIQKFNPNGDFVKVIGFHGDAPGAFARPKGLSIDDESHIYVADTAFENVQIFDAETGQIMLFIGGFTEQPGGMWLPNGIWIDYENVAYFQQYADKDFRIKYLLYVGNMAGPYRLNVYGFGEWIGDPLTGDM